MSLFKRAAVSEFASNASVVFSILVVIWLSIVLVRLLGEAANGMIGADVVLGLTGLTTIAALPTVLAATIFIGVLTTISRSYRESEMVVWFSSGLSLQSWVRPALRLSIPIAIVVALLTIFASPWSHRQIQEYRARYELRSVISQVTTGEFLELEGGTRVVLVEADEETPDKLGQVFVRINDAPWHSVVVSDHARTEVAPNGDRFLVLEQGLRYDLTPGGLMTRLWEFDEFAVRLDSQDAEQTLRQSREHAILNRKGRPTSMLLTDQESQSKGQLMWRLAIPIAAINLSLLAIPLGATNPRAGRSFEMLVAGLIALLYFNLINLSHSWVNNETLPFGVGVWLVHAVFFGLTLVLFWLRLRVRAPRQPADTLVSKSN